MIKLKRTTLRMGDMFLEIEYSKGDETFIVTIDRREIQGRLKQLQEILARKPTKQDVKEVIIQLISEVREGKEPIEHFDFSDFIGIDLEA